MSSNGRLARRINNPAICRFPAVSPPQVVARHWNSERDCSLASEHHIASKARNALVTIDFTTNSHRASSSLSHAFPHAAMADFDLFAGDFQFTDFSGFPNPILDPSLQSLSQPQPNLFSLQPTYASPTSSISPLSSGFDQASKKRQLENVTPGTEQSLDESVRVVAEEDKRRRNTAASARFRVKKKQREQALEKTAKDMSDKVNLMEVRIQQLETENTWLKSLITEKSGGKSSASELRALLTKREETSHGRSSPTHTDGVGTKVKDTKADA